MNIFRDDTGSLDVGDLDGQVTIHAYGPDGQTHAYLDNDMALRLIAAIANVMTGDK